MLQPRIRQRAIYICQKYPTSVVTRSYATIADKRAIPEAPRTTESTNYVSHLTRDSHIALRRYKPRTPGVRHLQRPINDHLWKGRPYGRLTFPKKGQGKGGRNASGQITVRHRGGGHKRRIRTVDFSRLEPGQHLVERIEHDPNRSAHIALMRSKLTGKVSYIIAAEGIRAGDVVESYLKGIPEELMEEMGGVVDPGVLAARTAIRGNCLPLHMVPIGTMIFNIGMRKGEGGIICRSAGTYATVMAKGDESLERRRRDEVEKAKEREIKEGLMTEAQKHAAQRMRDEDQRKAEKAAQFVTLKLASGEVRLIDRGACATVGVASNANYKYTQLGKAGRSRWLNIRPTVRGVAMNAMDHPHGGGRGKSKGNVHPKSIWGKPTKSGYKTRPRKHKNKAVVIPRERNQGKRRKSKN